MIFAVSEETWERFLLALIPLMVAVTAWLRGEYKDWKLGKQAKKAEERADSAERTADATRVIATEAKDAANSVCSELANHKKNCTPTK
jgi:hypothetical protein